MNGELCIFYGLLAADASLENTEEDVGRWKKQKREEINN